MAERRKNKKRSARQPEAAKPRSLLELPPAADPRGEPPTNPVIVVRPLRDTSLPPAPTEPMGDMSLASLALATRRGAADLMERMFDQSLAQRLPAAGVGSPATSGAQCACTVDPAGIRGASDPRVADRAEPAARLPVVERSAPTRAGPERAAAWARAT